jgi:hypothetical protein
MVFIVTFIVHGLSELGLTSELITATFYKQVVKGISENDILDDDDDRRQFKYSNMQVILLTISCMYFVLGSTLEYTRHSGLVVLMMTLALGALKVGLGSLKIYQMYTLPD